MKKDLVEGANENMTVLVYKYEKTRTRKKKRFTV